MLYHYFITTWRNLLKGYRHSLLSLFGLAISITAVLLISLYILSELSADRQHTKAGSIYRAGYHELQPHPIRTAISAAPMGPVLTSGYPEILSYVRVFSPSLLSINLMVGYNEKTIYEDGVLFADTNFFEFFDYVFVYGNPQQALASPGNIVLTEEKARLFFGDADPTGQIIRINGSHSLTVSAVVRPPKNPTHLRFHYLIPFYTIPDVIGQGVVFFNSFKSHNIYTYLLVDKGFNPDVFINTNLEGFVRRYLAPDPDAENLLEKIRLDFTALRKIYFDNDVFGEILNPDPVPHKGNKSHMLVFGMIALFLSVIAVINYTNIAIARSTIRAKEVGVRKVLGSSPMQLFGQYIGEAALFVVVAIILALIISEILVPGFNSIMNQNLSLSVLFDPANLFLLLSFIVIMSLISGSYPALYMARIRPMDAIRGQFKIKGKTMGIKNILFSFQFFVSVVMIVCTLLVYQQFRYMEKKDMGFATDDRLTFMLPDDVRITPEWISAFKNSLLQHADILMVSTSHRNPLPGRMIESWSLPVMKDYGKEELILNIGRVDHDFLDLFNIPVVAGRAFSNNSPSDLQDGALINETALRDFGWQDPIGMTIQRYETTYRVLGVVKDFHFFSLHQPIMPMMLLATNKGREVSVLLAGSQAAGGLQALHQTWEEFLPEYPLDYEFIDRQLVATMVEEKKTARMLPLLTIFAIFISLAGLFGMSAFVAEQRTREIAIRRTYGASLLHIVGVLLRGAGRLLGLALLLAIPVSYLYMSRWLEDFSYRIELTPWPFIAAISSTVIITFITIWVHAVRTSAGNPVDNLRGE